VEARKSVIRSRVSCTGGWGGGDGRESKVMRMKIEQVERVADGRSDTAVSALRIPSVPIGKMSKPFLNLHDPHPQRQPMRPPLHTLVQSHHHSALMTIKEYSQYVEVNIESLTCWA